MADDARVNTPLLNTLAQVAATIYAARFARGESGPDAIIASANEAISVMIGVIAATRDLDEMLRSTKRPPEADATPPHGRRVTGGGRRARSAAQGGQGLGRAPRRTR